MKNIILFLVVFFFFSCAQNKVEIVKYKDFYDFGSFLKIKSLEFKPFPNNISFKTKNTLIFLKNNKKYTFYSIIYSYNNYCRIFSYALFGKKVGDIFFLKNTIYFIPPKFNEVYIIKAKEQELEKSIFNFLKDVVKGIVLNNVFTENNCYMGFYNNKLSKICTDSGFRKFLIGDKKVEIVKSKNNFPEKLVINFGEKLLIVKVKEIIKPEKDPKEIFFDSIKKLKKYYLRDIIKLEKAIFMESKNES